MKIYTRAGDEGQTGLLYGDRVSKNSVLPEAYGTVDEAQAILGLVRTECEKGSDLEDKIIHIERDLYVLMAELATDPSKHDKLKPGKSKVNEEMIIFLEDFFDDITSSFEFPYEFVLPVQNRISALLDVSLIVVRRPMITAKIRSALVNLCPSAGSPINVMSSSIPSGFNL